MNFTVKSTLIIILILVHFKTNPLISQSSFKIGNQTVKANAWLRDYMTTSNKHSTLQLAQDIIGQPISCHKKNGTKNEVVILTTICIKLCT